MEDTMEVIDFQAYAAARQRAASIVALQEMLDHAADDSEREFIETNLDYLLNGPPEAANDN